MARFAYDEVPYDTEANSDTHPTYMATVARLCGLHPALPSGCRVLEVGCGTGENIISAAGYLPHASFVGFDLAVQAIELGIEVAKRGALRNVELFQANICDVKERGLEAFGPERAGPFDYVIVHGIYSWVPEFVRRDLLALVHDALAPTGVAFISFHAYPGFSLRNGLRELALDATRNIHDPEAKVREALKVIGEIARKGEKVGGFFGVLSAEARDYLKYVDWITGPELSYPRSMFHDLLAEHNEGFSVSQFEERLAAADLRMVSEIPLRSARAHERSGFDLDMRMGGGPYLQLLVQRDDGPPGVAPHAAPLADMLLWADLRPVGEGTFRTTTGASVKPVGDDPWARAARSAPGFVPVRSLTNDDEQRTELTEELFRHFCDSIFMPVAEAPPCAFEATERPRIAEHARALAEMASERRSPSIRLPNALNRTFRIPGHVLRVLRYFDGKHDVDAIAEKIRPLMPGKDPRLLVNKVIHDAARYLYLCEGEP